MQLDRLAAAGWQARVLASLGAVVDPLPRDSIALDDRRLGRHGQVGNPVEVDGDQTGDLLPTTEDTAAAHHLLGDRVVGLERRDPVGIVRVQGGYVVGDEGRYGYRRSDGAGILGHDPAGAQGERNSGREDRDQE